MKNRLKELRKSRGLTQTQLGEKTYLSKYAISHYEHGVRNIPNELLIKFAIILDTTTDEILDVDSVRKEFENKE